MRCRDVETLWDDIRGECQASLKEAVHTHLNACPPCQEAYEQYEGVAYCLSCLPIPEASCDLKKRVVEHIAQLKHGSAAPIELTSVETPIGRLYVGFKEHRIAYVGLDTGEAFEVVRIRIEHRLRRAVSFATAPSWLQATLDAFFQTWHIDAAAVDISTLTRFEQDVLRAAAQIPPGEVRSYGWVASQAGRPKAARAVGRVMARNPVPFLMPCHRVVASTGDLHHYGMGLEMKAKLLRMEGYRPER